MTEETAFGRHEADDELRQNIEEQVRVDFEQEFEDRVDAELEELWKYELREQWEHFEYMMSDEITERLRFRGEYEPCEHEIQNSLTLSFNAERRRRAYWDRNWERIEDEMRPRAEQEVAALVTRVLAWQTGQL